MSLHEVVSNHSVNQKRRIEYLQVFLLLLFQNDWFELYVFLVSLFAFAAFRNTNCIFPVPILRIDLSL